MLKKLLAMMALLLALAIPVQFALAENVGAGEGGPAGVEAKPGLLDVNITQIVWVMVLFVILVIILYRTAWKNVLSGLKSREDRIRNDIAQAESARTKAEQTLADYNQQLLTAEGKVKQLLSQAATDAEKIASGIRVRAQQESEEMKERALKDIDASRQQALSEIYEQAANLSTAVAEKILRRNLNADDQRELVSESLKQIQSLEV